MADLPYVIVPKVPTDEMIAAGTPANQHTEWPAEVVYAEMLDASPPPVSLEEIVEVLSSNATMLEKQAPEIFPDVNEDGRVHFGRAVMESAAEELRSLLSRLKGMGK